MSTSLGAAVTKTIEVVYNSVNLTVNGTKVNADNILYNGTTYVPLRAVAEALGKDVGWDQKTNTASINDKGFIHMGSSELNDDEQFILDSVLKYSKDLKSPSSVRVLETNPLYDWNDFRTITLQASNSYGATVIDYYYLFHNSVNLEFVLTVPGT